MVKLLATDHLADRTAAFDWLVRQPFVQTSRIATTGNSFGGLEALFGAQHLGYCAAIDASGGAESWAQAPELRVAMTRTVRDIPILVLFFQAKNDYDVAPSGGRDRNQLADCRACRPGHRRSGPGPHATDRDTAFQSAGGYPTYILPAALVLILQQTLLIGVDLLGTHENPSLLIRDMLT